MTTRTTTRTASKIGDFFGRGPGTGITAGGGIAGAGEVGRVTSRYWDGRTSPHLRMRQTSQKGCGKRRRQQAMGSPPRQALIMALALARGEDTMAARAKGRLILQGATLATAAGTRRADVA